MKITTLNLSQAEDRRELNLIRNACIDKHGLLPPVELHYVREDVPTLTRGNIVFSSFPSGVSNAGYVLLFDENGNEAREALFFIKSVDVLDVR